MRKKQPVYFFLINLLGVFFLGGSFLAAAIENNTISSKNIVEVVGHQLFVNKKPYVIKGVCYSPVPKGGTYPDNLITQNPTPDDLLVIEKDFQMMQAAGINTLRVYKPILDRNILNLLEKYQLKIIVPICDSYQAGDKERRTVLNALKDEPTTLFWEVGNECNLNYFLKHSFAQNNLLGLQELAAFANEITALIREIDSNHPISLGLGIPAYSELEIQQPYLDSIANIDLYGLNFYNELMLDDVLTKPSLLINKPFYFSEVGATAYNLASNGVAEGALASNVSSLLKEIDNYHLFGVLPKKFVEKNPPGALPGGGVFAEDENAQADGITSLLRQIKNNLSTTNPKHLLLGGCIFEWNDEWWKAPWKKRHKDLSLHSIGGSVLANNEGITSWGPYPDHVFHEEWFGIMTIDRVPRAAYWALQKIYLEP